MVADRRKKMGKGNILDCLRMARHHVDSHKADLMQVAGVLFGDMPVMRYRSRILREELDEAISRIERIKEIAEQQHLQEIIDILSEEFEFGHDLGGVSEEDSKPA